MNSKRFVGILAGLAGVALLVGGVATASNMGFKFVPNVGGSQAFNLSLPWNNNYTDAQSLLTDTGAVSVQRLTGSSSGLNLTSWTGSIGVNFPITKGEGYVINAGGGGLTPTVVGSHDPNFTLNFTGGQVLNTSAPYHQTLTTANGLLSDMNTNGSPANSVSRLQRFTSTSSIVTWTGSIGVNFNLTLGEAVIVDANTSFSYDWPHY